MYYVLVTIQQLMQYNSSCYLCPFGSHFTRKSPLALWPHFTLKHSKTTFSLLVCINEAHLERNHLRASKIFITQFVSI